MTKGTGKGLVGALVLAAVVAGGTTGCSDSPTRDDAPTIAQLRVQGALRVSGDTGVVGLSFDYVDPDRDINRVVFSTGGGNSATNLLSDATLQSGTVSIQQAVTLPAPGTEVAFTVFVFDRRGNRSNELTGTFVAP